MGVPIVFSAAVGTSCCVSGEEGGTRSAHNEYSDEDYNDDYSGEYSDEYNDEYNDEYSDEVLYHSSMLHTRTHRQSGEY